MIRSKQMASWWMDLGQIRFDRPVLIILFIMISTGLLLIYSAGEQNIGLVDRQAIRYVIGLIAMFIAAAIPRALYFKWIPLIYISNNLLLSLVLLIGHVGKGAQRWIHLGPIQFEPSEFTKIILPLTLGFYLHHKTLPLSGKSLIGALMIMICPILLIAKQPDLGTATMLLVICSSTLFVAGLPWRTMGVTLISLLSLCPFIWHFMHTYQKKRIITFLYPENDPMGAGYHIIQSKIAIGSGGLLGKGLLQGTQAHLQFLPEHTTDFIFSLCAEEFGFVGCLLLLMIYVSLSLRILYLSYYNQDTFARLVTATIAMILFFSALINIGMVSGLFPVVGLPLPLLSYGGSSMITLMIAIGLCFSLTKQRKLMES